MGTRPGSLMIAGLALVFYAAFPKDSFGQLYPQWGNLKPGPYCVGFKIEFLHDYGRTFRPKVSFEGQKNTGNIYRPIALSIWYPAKRSAHPDRMLQKEYVDDIGLELQETGTTEERKQAGFDEFKRMMGLALSKQRPVDEQLKRILNTRTAAIKDAMPEAGAFPLVMNIPFGIRGQSIISEYLASHGYVVASIPLFGPDQSTRQFNNRLVDVEAMIADLEF